MLTIADVMNDKMQRESADAGVRPIYVIGQEIFKDWKNVYFGAVPYLDAMRALVTVDDDYGCDDARSIILYFLANAQSWRGETAKRVKLELKGMVKR